MADVNTFSGTNVLGNLNGFYKQIYGDNLLKLVPDNSKLINSIGFERRKKLGDLYHVAVSLQNEQGFTYNDGSGIAFDLAGPVAMGTQDAQVRGSEIVLQSQISYKAAAAAASTKEAFAEATSMIFENMMESASNRLELAVLYGQSSKGAITASANVDTLTATITLSAASWSIGIWTGRIGAKIELYTGASPPVLISTGANSIFYVAGIDIPNRKLTLTGTTTGITALGTAASGFSAANGSIYWYGAKTAEMVGVDKIITTSGTLFGINNTLYPLWKGNEYTVAGALTLDEIRKSVDLAVSQGLNEAVTAYCSPRVFTSITNNVMTNRRFDSSYKGSEAQQGFESIKIFASNGIISVEPHTIVKQGEVFIIPTKRFMRVGATDFTMQTPGMGNDIFLQMTNKAGYEVRMYTDQAVFCESPARCTKISGFDIP
jgi:hypothetical protein